MTITEISTSNHRTELYVVMEKEEVERQNKEMKDIKLQMEEDG